MTRRVVLLCYLWGCFVAICLEGDGRIGFFVLLDKGAFGSDAAPHRAVVCCAVLCACTGATLYIEPAELLELNNTEAQLADREAQAELAVLQASPVGCAVVAHGCSWCSAERATGCITQQREHLSA